MNAAQIHLALNHAPLLLSIVGGCILLLGFIKKNESFKSLSLLFLVAAAVFTVPVFLTGEGTEELVENLPGVNKSSIETHEGMAKISLIVIIIAGVLSLAGLLLKKNQGITRFIFAGVLILSLASFSLMAITAHNGGLIRHGEIQNRALNNSNENNDNEKEESEGRGNDTGILKQEKVFNDSLQQGEKNREKEDDDD